MLRRIKTNYPRRLKTNLSKNNSRNLFSSQNPKLLMTKKNLALFPELNRGFIFHNNIVCVIIDIIMKRAKIFNQQHNINPFRNTTKINIFIGKIPSLLA